MYSTLYIAYKDFRLWGFGGFLKGQCTHVAYSLGVFGVPFLHLHNTVEDKNPALPEGP